MLGEDPSLYDYWMAVYSRKGTVATVAGCAFAFALAFSWLLPPVYEARASLYVPLPPAADAAQSTSPLMPVADEKSGGANLGILKSKAISSRVAQLVPGTRADDLKRNVDFVLGKEFLVEIYARDRDATRSAQIANSFARAYNEFHANAMAQRSARRREALELQLVTVNDRLDKANQRLLEHQADTGLMGASYDRAKLSDVTKNVEAEINLARADLAATRERLRKMEQQTIEEKAAYSPDDAAVSSPQIELLRQRISEMELRLADRLASLGEQHPSVIVLQQSLVSARNDLRREAARSLASGSARPGSTYESLRQQLIEQRNRESYLQARLAALDRSLTDTQLQRRTASPALNESQTLQREVDQLEQLQLSIQRNLETVRSEEVVPMATVVTVEVARPPEKPAFPRPVLNALVALVVGVAAGGYYALLLDYLQRAKFERLRRHMDRSVLPDDMVDA